MVYISLLFLGLTIGFSGAMLPGPLLIFTIERVLKRDIQEGIKIVFGHIIIEALVIALILIGLTAIWSSKFILNIISLIGGTTLIVMGTLMFSRSYKYSVSFDVQSAKGKFKYGAILGGIFFSAFNPTFPIWWGTIGASLLSRALLIGVIGVVALTIGHWLADLMWYMSVSFAVAKGKKFINQSIYHAIIKILAILLVCFGVYFLLKTDLG